MTTDTVVWIGRDAMIVTLLASAPMLMAGMVIGLIISVFQSVTQIQEITLTFVPKIVATLLAFILFLPWMMDLILNFVYELYNGLGGFIA